MKGPIIDDGQSLSSGEEMSGEYGQYSGYDKRKRYRRTANEIERRF